MDSYALIKKKRPQPLQEASTCQGRSAENVRTRWGFYKKGPPLHRCATNDGRHRMAAMQLMRYSTWKVCCGTALPSSCRGGQKESVVSLPVSCARVSCCSWPRFYPHSLVASRHSDTLSSCPRFSFSLIKLRNKGRHSP